MTSIANTVSNYTSEKRFQWRVGGGGAPAPKFSALSGPGAGLQTEKSLLTSLREYASGGSW